LSPNDPPPLGTQYNDQPAELPKPKRGFAQWRIMGVFVAIFLLAGAIYAGITLAGQNTAKTTPSPSPQAGISAAERTALGDKVSGGSTILQVTQVIASQGQIDTLLAKALQVTGEVSLGTNLTVKGNGSFGGNITAANFVGNGAGLTNINATNLQGRIADTQLSANVALRNAPNTFSSTSTFSGTVNVSGPASLTGTTTISNLILGAPLKVSNGGTGLTTIPVSGVVYGQGAASVGVAVPSAAGQCLVSTATDVQFGSCSSVAAGVASVDGLAGVLTIANSTGSGATVTINDATTAAKGISSFNATNFSVVGGAVNTIQNIAVGSTPSFAGLNLTAALTVPNGGTGATTLASNGVIVGQGAGALIAVTAGAAGQCLISNAGAPSFQACPGGGGVTSVNAQAGVLTIANASAAAGTITINDATTAAKGIASFNAGNFSVAGGAVNTIQNISVGSTPLFAGLNLTAALTLANGGTGATTAGAGRVNLGAAASGANADITALSGLTTAITTAQGGTGIVTTPTNGQVLIGTSAGYSLNTLTAGAGITITNGSGTITIASPSGGTCGTCANTALSNLAGVAINTSLLPGSAGGANLGSAVLPFGQLALAGSSASPATNNFLITGASTGGTRTITLPDASGTVAVSATGPLSLDAVGNLTCATCLTSGGGGAGGVSSVNVATGALTLQGATAGSVTTAGSTITINDATAAVKGLASFNATNFSVTSGAVNTIQDIATTSTPTFGGLNLASALTIGNGGSGATTAAAARTNLSAAKSGANADITSLSGLSTALSVSQGGIGTTTLATDGVVLGNGASALSAITGTNGQCLIVVGTTPTFGTCTGAGGVASVNSQTGAVTIANASAAAGTVTINDATTGAKGIASFNSTNFSVTSGAVNTIQDIAVGSTPTFGGLNLTAALTVPNGGTGASTLATDSVLLGNGASPISGITGTNGQCLVISGTTPTFGTCSGSGGVASLNSQTGAVTLANATASAGTVTINDATTGVKGISSFNATNFSVASGAVNTVQNIAVASTPTFGSLTLTSAASLSLGVASTNTGSVLFKGSGGAGTLTLLGPTNPNAGNFSVTLPAVTGNANICTDNAICAGYASSAGLAGTYVQLQGSTPGSAQTGHLNITGTAIAGTVAAGTSLTVAATNFAVNATGDIAFGNNADHTISVAAASGNPGNNLSLSAGNGNGTNKAGGNLVLSGGLATGTGLGGAVIVKPQTNGTSAFLVQNAASTGILAVDTINSQVGINTNTPNSPLDIVGVVVRMGPTQYAVNLPFPGSSYLVMDKNNTASDASIVMRDAGAIRAEIGIVTDNNIHFKTASGAAGSETFTDRLIINTAGDTYTTGKLGVGTTPSEQLHVAALNSGAKVLAKIENTNSGAGSKGSGFQLVGGAGINWTVGSDVGLNGGNNFAIQDNIAGYQPRLLIDSSGNIGLGTDSPSASISFAAGAAHTINVNSNVGVGNALTIAAGNSGGTNQAGGDLTLSGGVASGTGIGGAVVVKSQTNAIAAFQVQNAAGTSNVLVADTINSRIGIGTAAPSAPLHISGSNSGARILERIENTNAAAGSKGSGIQLVDGATVDWTIGTDAALNGTSNFFVQDNVAGYPPRLLLDSTGRLGLGTDSPSASLSFANGANRTINVVAAVSGNAGNTLTLAGGDGTGTNQAGGNLLLAGGTATGTGLGGSVVVKSPTNSLASFQVQNAAGTSNTLVVDTINSRVGIGTATPSAPLDISGSNSGARVLAKIQNTNAGAGSKGSALQLVDGAAIDWTVGTDAGLNGTNNFFITDNIAGYPPRLMIDSSGRVGFGTDSPSASLSFAAGASRSINVVASTGTAAGNDLSVTAGNGNGTNQAGGNLLLIAGNSTGSGAPGSVVIKPQTNSTTAFQVQSATGTVVLNADTTSGKVILGQVSTLTGQLTFANGSNAFGVTIAAGTTASSYNLTLPTSLAASGDCLKDSTGAGVLAFSSCITGAVSLQATTPGSAQTGNLNITGTAIVGTALQVPSIAASAALTVTASGTNRLTLGTVGAGTVEVGGTNTGTVLIGNNNGATFAGSASQIAIGNTSASTAIALNATGTSSTITLSTSGSQLLQSGNQVTVSSLTNDTRALSVTNATAKKILTVDTSGNIVTIGDASNVTAQLSFANAATANFALIQGGATSATYTSTLPTAIGSANQCLAVSSIASTTQSLGYSNCLTTATGVQLQASTPGSAQTGNLNLTGIGIFGTAVATGSIRASADSIAAVKLQNAAGSTTVLDIDTINNRVGIGTSAPTEALHISGSNNVARILTKIQNTNVAAGSKGTGFQLIGSGVDWTFGTDIGLNGGNNFAIQDNTFGYQPRLFFDSSGQLGLGTDSPTASLTFANGANRTININTASAAVGNSLTLQAGSGNGTNMAGGDLLMQGGASTGTGAGGHVIVKPQTNSTTAFQVQNAAGTSNAFIVDTTNNRIGVGTAAPSDPLHIAAANTSAKVLAKIENTNAAAGSKGSGFQLLGSSGVNWTVGTDVGLTGGNNFAVQDNTFGYQPRLIIDSSGQLGLGTDTPTASLSFANGANRTINVNTAAAASNGDTLTLQAGTGNGTNKAGGNLVLQAGAATGTGTAGVVIVKAQTNSASAFQVQNTSGTSALTVDTTTMTVTVSALVVTNDISLAGHIVTTGIAPTIAAGTAACTTPTVSVAGTDIAGTISITTGTGCGATGKLAALTFHTAYGTGPTVTLTAANAAAAGLQSYVSDATISTTSADLDTANAPANSTSYKWNYHIIE
jgi:hypothetical protein